MTVETVTSTSVQHYGDTNYTTSSDFVAAFKYLSTSEIKVVYTSNAGADTDYVEGTHYAVTSGASGTSVTIRFLSGYVPSNNTAEYVTIYRDMAFTQGSDYTSGSELDAETLEQNFDKSIMIAQQLQFNNSARNISFSQTADYNSTASAASDISVSKANRASKYLAFDSAGDIAVTGAADGIVKTSADVAGHILRYDSSESAYVNSAILALDDTKIWFGSGDGSTGDVSIEYDENGNDTLSINGDTLLEDDKKLYFGSGKDCYIEYDENGQDTMVLGLPTGGGQIHDDKPLYFGTEKDVLVEWDDGGDDTLLFQAASSESLNIGLYADAGENNHDKWKLSVIDNTGQLEFLSKISGSFVNLFSILPHATPTSSTVTIAGNLTVSGTTYTVDAENLLIEDPLIYLAKANTSSDNLDIGLYGVYDVGGTDKFSGLFRDRSDSGKWKLFKDLSGESTLLNGTASEVNTGGTGYAVATLVANLEGNVTGNVTGTINTVTVADESSDTSCYPLFVTGASGSLAPKSGSNLTFNSSTGVLTATGFAGPLTGNVTGNVTGNTSGTAATVTGAAQSAITSVGTLTSLALSGNIDLADDTSIGISDTEERIEFDGAGDISVLDAKFGIGTNAPATKFHVVDNHPDWSLKHVNTHSGGYGLVMSAGGASSTSMLIMDYNEANTLFELKGNGTTYLKGNVGIGTSSPSSPLGISKFLEIEHADNASLVLSETGTGDKWEIAHASSELRFYYHDGASGNYRMVINASGNVGIGDAVPTEAKLSIVQTSGLPAININQDGAAEGIYIDQDGNGRGITIANASLSDGILINNSNASNGQSGLDVLHAGTGPAISIDHDGSGRAFELHNSAGGTGMFINQTYANYGVELKQDGASVGLFIDQNAAGEGLKIVSDQTDKYCAIFENVSDGYGLQIKAGSATTEHPLEVKDSAGTTRFWVAGDGAGWLYATSWTYGSSDSRLKKNISPISDAVSKINQISGVNYEWKNADDYEDGVVPYADTSNPSDVGVLAQEIEKVLPEAVLVAGFDNNDKNYLSVRYDRIIPLLIEGIKELSTKVTALENA